MSKVIVSNLASRGERFETTRRDGQEHEKRSRVGLQTISKLNQPRATELLLLAAPTRTGHQA
jgi:hypothetical protein